MERAAWGPRGVRDLRVRRLRDFGVSCPGAGSWLLGLMWKGFIELVVLNCVFLVEGVKFCCFRFVLLKLLQVELAFEFIYYYYTIRMSNELRDV